MIFVSLELDRLKRVRGMPNDFTDRASAARRRVIIETLRSGKRLPSRKRMSPRELRAARARMEERHRADREREE